MPFTEKLLTARPALHVGGRRLKCYHVTADPDGIEPEVEKAAHAILPDLLPEPDGTPGSGFVVLHRGRDDGAYLNAYTWAWDNALYFSAAAAGQPFLGCPDEDPAHFVKLAPGFIGCVFELPPLTHERDAWTRHVLTPDHPDLDAYLAAHLPNGPTGPRT